MGVAARRAALWLVLLLAFLGASCVALEAGQQHHSSKHAILSIPSRVPQHKFNPSAPHLHLIGGEGAASQALTGLETSLSWSRMLRRRARVLALATTPLRFHVTAGSLEEGSFTMELPRVSSVASFTLSNLPDTPETHDECGTKDFRIMVSEDGVKWRNVFVGRMRPVEHAMLALPGRPSVSSQLFTLRHPEDAKFVRVNTMSRYKGGAGGGLKIEVMAKYGLGRMWAIATHARDALNPPGQTKDDKPVLCGWAWSEQPEQVAMQPMDWRSRLLAEYEWGMAEESEGLIQEAHEGAKRDKAQKLKRLPDGWSASKPKLGEEGGGLVEKVVGTVWLQFKKVCKVATALVGLRSEVVLSIGVLVGGLVMAKVMSEAVSGGLAAAGPPWGGGKKAAEGKDERKKREEASRQEEERLREVTRREVEAIRREEKRFREERRQEMVREKEERKKEAEERKREAAKQRQELAREKEEAKKALAATLEAERRAARAAEEKRKEGVERERRRLQEAEEERKRNKEREERMAKERAEKEREAAKKMEEKRAEGERAREKANRVAAEKAAQLKAEKERLEREAGAKKLEVQRLREQRERDKEEKAREIEAAAQKLAREKEAVRRKEQQVEAEKRRVEEVLSKAVDQARKEEKRKAEEARQEERRKAEEARQEERKKAEAKTRAKEEADDVYLKEKEEREKYKRQRAARRKSEREARLRELGLTEAGGGDAGGKSEGIEDMFWGFWNSVMGPGDDKERQKGRVERQKKVEERKKAREARREQRRTEGRKWARGLDWFFENEFFESEDKS
mmetsp:Transcript_50190/g.120240  ORF Transcript_50190/g.120240 Transcript_50190/m.120240 type:complete len:797 (-) Transcript_50190:341-2731(-)